VIEEPDLNEFMGGASTRFVFDEYYAALSTAKIVSDYSGGQINPIFLLGQTKKVIMASAHKS
jgi:hypothetical protein